MSANVPDYVKEYVDRGKSLDDSERYDEAIAIYRQALEKYPDVAVLHNNLGCSLANKERYEEAAKEFIQAITLTTLNREAGLPVPSSYPSEPEQNLRTAQSLITGKAPKPSTNFFLEVFFLSALFAILIAFLAVGYLVLTGSNITEAYQFTYTRQLWFLFPGVVLALFVASIRGNKK
jgi:tetratricopeptide (TPR) repeat protein